MNEWFDFIAAAKQRLQNAELETPPLSGEVMLRLWKSDGQRYYSWTVLSGGRLRRVCWDHACDWGDLRDPIECLRRTREPTLTVRDIAFEPGESLASLRSFSWQPYAGIRTGWVSCGIAFEDIHVDGLEDGLWPADLVRRMEELAD